MTKYALKPSIVRDFTESIKDENIHAHFAAYLGLVRYAHDEGSDSDLHWNYDPYYDQFYRMKATGVRNMVIDGSEKLYVVPFMDSHIHSMWKGENVAGSLSPGTAGRATSSNGLHRVANIDPDAGTYGLRDDHGQLAREHTCYGDRVPATPVVGFLLRDYAFEMDEEPELSDVVELFREEFGMGEDQEYGDAFNEVFDTTDWDIEEPFEVYND